MKITKLKFNFSLCFLLEIILVAGIAISTILGQDRIVSILFALTFIVLFAYFAKDIFSNGFKNNFSTSAILLVALCVVNVLLDLFFSNGSLSFDYLKKLIMFCSFILLLNYAVRENNALSSKALTVIKILPVAVSVIFVASYFIFNNNQLIAGGITLGYNNPNETGMWLLHLLFFCVLFLVEGFKRSKWSWLVIPILPIMVYLIIKTRSRACLLGLAAFVGLLLFGFLRRRVGRPLTLLIAVFPLVFALLYLVFIDAEWFNNLFSFASSEGKPLSSRVTVWREAFENFMTDPFLGTYYLISDGTGVSQLHNTHIDVLCSYGILPAILFIKILYDSMRSVNSKANSWYGYVSFCAFCAVIIVGSFEAAMVSGSTGLNMLTVAFLVLAKSDMMAISSNEAEK